MTNFYSATGLSPVADHATLTEIRSVIAQKHGRLTSKAADRRPQTADRRPQTLTKLCSIVFVFAIMASYSANSQWAYYGPNLPNPPATPPNYAREIFNSMVGIGAFQPKEIFPTPPLEPKTLLHLHSTATNIVEGQTYFPAYLRLQTQKQGIDGQNINHFGSTAIEFFSGSTLDGGVQWCAGKIMGVTSGQGVNATGTPLFQTNPPATIDLRGGLAFYCSPSSSSGLPTGLPNENDQLEVMRIVDKKVGIGTMYPQAQLHATKQIMTGESGFNTYDADKRGILSFMPGSNSIQYHMDNRNGVFHISHGASPGDGSINSNGSGKGDIMDILGWSKSVSIGATLSGGSYLRTFPIGTPACSSGPAVGGAKLTVSDEPLVLYTTATTPEPYLIVNPIVLRLERRNVFTADNLTTPYKLISAGDGSAESFIVKSNGGIVSTPLGGTGTGYRAVFASSTGELTTDASIVGSAGSWSLGGNDIGSNSYFLGTVTANQHLIIKTNSTQRLKIFSGNSTDNKTYFQFGATYYNTSTSGQGLPSGLTCRVAVDGQVVAKEYLCKANTWSDFVFAKGYVLPTLEEVENHIKKNGHLEGIPSAREVEEQGINLADMQAKLLQKVEELTLYMIELKKENQQLKKLFSNSK